MCKMVPAEATLMCTVMPVEASMLVEYQSWDSGSNPMQVGHLGECLATMSWRETATQELQKERPID